MSAFLFLNQITLVPSKEGFHHYEAARCLSEPRSQVHYTELGGQAANRKRGTNGACSSRTRSCSGRGTKRLGYNDFVFDLQPHPY